MKKLSITREELVDLFPKGLKIAEIGVFKGAYAKKLEESLPSQLTLIDVWCHVDSDTVYGKLDPCNLTDRGFNKIHKKVVEMFKENANVEIVREFSGIHVDNVEDGHYDVVYIDGDHSYTGCLSDMVAWSKKVAVTGFIYGHDYTDSFPWIEIKPAVDKFLVDNPDWSLVAITSEVPKKSPSWILAKEGSIIFDILKEELSINSSI
jgi:hypothetical protein